jgi:hypothetical protein
MIGSSTAAQLCVQVKSAPLSLFFFTSTPSQRYTEKWKNNPSAVSSLLLPCPCKPPTNNHSQLSPRTRGSAAVTTPWRLPSEWKGLPPLSSRIIHHRQPRSQRPEPNAALCERASVTGKTDRTGETGRVDQTHHHPRFRRQNLEKRRLQPFRGSRGAGGLLAAERGGGSPHRTAQGRGGRAERPRDPPPGRPRQQERFARLAHAHTQNNARINAVLEPCGRA